MTKRPPQAEPAAVAAYIDAAPEPARSRLLALAEAIRAEAPDAIERMAYGLATWHQRENLIHLGAFAHHVGVYPGSAAIMAFAEELAAFKTSKGAIQVAHEAALPVELVRRITRWRIEQAALRPMKKNAATARRQTLFDVGSYHAAQTAVVRATCDALAAIVAGTLPEAVGKVWHGHPVFFLEENPVVGYSVHKEGVRLLFWSGQSFDEPGLSPVGKFKAAEARFGGVDDIDAEAIQRWLAKARDIQWDYKHVAKRKGVLARLR
jgi:uncharacterized protein YdhG (YjbR/CyaY superfamily)